MGAELVTLDSGLKVLTKESKANDIIALSVLVGMGSSYESDEEAGLSNLTQSVLLKGTENRSAEELMNQIDSAGIKLSSSASRDSGSVYLLCTTQGLDVGLDLLFDVLLNPTFPSDEVDKEKEQTLLEIAAKEDQLMSKAMELLAEVHYGVHPYHKPLLGYPETVKRFERADIEPFFRKHYVPGNMIFSAVGNLDAEELVGEVQKRFDVKTSPEKPEGIDTEVPRRVEPAALFKERESQAAWIGIGYNAPRITDDNYAAMEVLHGVIGGSMNSRLFVELRDKRGLAYQVGSMYAARPGPSLFVSYIGTSVDQFEEAKDGILQEIKKIASLPVTDEELRLSKTYLKGTFIMGQEGNSSQASLLAHYEHFGLGYGFVDEYPKLIDDVSIEDVLRVGEENFDDNYALGCVMRGTPE